MATRLYPCPQVRLGELSPWGWEERVVEQQGGPATGGGC